MKIYKGIYFSFALAAASALALAGCFGSSGSDNNGDADFEAETEAESETIAIDPVPYVNQFIATAGPGFSVGSAIPGPYAPFGQVKPSPDTLNKYGGAEQFYHCAGYYYNDVYISGFSHTHLYGTGVPDYGNLSLLPVIGADPGKTKQDKFKQTFDRDTEIAKAAYYAVTLGNGARAELTATERVAMHRYSYPASAGGDSCVLIDLGHVITGGEIIDSSLEINKAAGEFSGFVNAKGDLTGRVSGYTLYFAGKAAQTLESVSTWDADYNLVEGKTNCGGKVCGGFMCAAKAEKIEIALAVSFVSKEGAKANLAAEAAGMDFDKVRAQTEEIWRKDLTKIRVKGGTEEDKTIFYTALLHVLSMPTLMSDVDGSYMGFDGQKHVVDWGGKNYSDFSLWDTYRTQHPLLTLVYDKYQRDFLYSLYMIAKLGGYFPKWALANGEANCMIGSPADSVVVDSYLKGIDFPYYSEAFDYCMKTALGAPDPGSGFGGRGGVSYYLEYGYLPSDLEGGSVSKVQEYAFSDNALCIMGTALGNKAEQTAKVCKNKDNWKNNWDPDKKFFIGKKKDGAFDYTKWNPVDWLDFYTEGNAWNYLTYVPQDMPALMEIMGGRDAFIARLEEMFRLSKEYEENIDDAEKKAPRPYYWAGNEIDIQAPWQFSGADRVDLTCKWVRWAARTFYKNAPDGLPGNDDAGTMSAWYIFAALGFYPIAGTDDYFVGCPLFDEAQVDLPSGKTLVIKREGAAGDEAVPSKITINGTPLEKPMLKWAQIKDGGELKFEMR